MAWRPRRAGHHQHRSTVAPFSFLPGRALGLAPGCRRRAASPHSSRDAVAPPPTGPATGSRRPPRPPMWRAPVPRLPARKSLPGGTKEGGRRTLTPARAPVTPVLPGPVRSDGSALPPARSCRSASRRASAAPAGSLGSGPARIPASPRHLPPKPSTRHRYPDSLLPAEQCCAPRAADEPAAVAAWAFRHPQRAL